MNISELADIQAQKENRVLAFLLLIGFVSSTCIHAAVMIAPVPTLWKPISKELDDTLEILVDKTTDSEEKVVEAAQAVKVPEPISPIEPAQSIEAAPVAIALAPENIASLKEGKDAAAPDNFKPLTTSEGSDTKIQSGGGSIITKNGIGSGFGNDRIPTGFVLGGKINGNPNGSKNGVINGIINGSPNGKGTQTNSIFPTIPLPIPSQPSNSQTPKLECISCPKPQYRGKEGTPRVTYDIAPDGRVLNVRLRQSSGDAQTDRETLEAMSKWQFNPKTIPEGGRTNVKVRVTFEEEGSKFQRENEERRRQQSEQLANQQAEPRKLSEENRQREVEPAKPTAATTPVTPEPLRSTPPSSPPAPVTQPITEPITPPAASIVNTAPPVAPAAEIDSPPPPPVDPATTPSKQSKSS